MDRDRVSQIDLEKLPSPCFIVDELALEKNLNALNQVQEKSGAKILLALKAFAMFSLFPQIATYLHGTSASSVYEARLGKEEFGKLVQTYSPAYSRSDIEQLVSYSDYLIFNSVDQWQRFQSLVPSRIHCGLRVNPEYSEIGVDLYNPCAVNSRLGIPLKNFPENPLGISGLHFHALCEQNADTLERIYRVVEEKFGSHFSNLSWINLGGGHHITREDYDLDLLVTLVKSIKDRYDLEVFLEPGEAVALNTGILMATVLDIVDNGMQIAILDTSAEAHMPDVLAMPYRPEIYGAGNPGTFGHTYRLSGPTCLAGDLIGDYSFKKPLQVGDKLVFADMAHYTMVKNNMFNGVQLPALVVYTRNNQLKIVKQFAYEDYKSRLS